MSTEPKNNDRENLSVTDDDADLDYELELMRTVETLGLKNDDSSDAIMQKLGLLFQSKGTNQ